MPEFNLVNHNFCGALDTYKSITIVIQESEHEWQEIYHNLQLCTDLISYIKETIERYLNRNRFAEPVPLDTNIPPPAGLMRDAHGNIHPPAGAYTGCTPP